jgi:hypothetical protein
MPNVTREMRDSIVDMLDKRFSFENKFMRVAVMAAKLGIWVYQKQAKKMRNRRNRIKIINRLRKRALFVIRT